MCDWTKCQIKAYIQIAVFTFLFLGLSHTRVAAFEAGDWLVRVKGIGMITNNKGAKVSTSLTPPPSPLPFRLNADSFLAPEVNFSYMWTQNISTELSLSTARFNIRLNSEISLSATLAELFNLVVGGAIGGSKIGHTWIFPPTLLLQYHFFPCCRFQPYLGVGATYTWFYGEKCKLPGVKFKLNPCLGVAAQAGMDVLMGDGWFVNLDIKYISMYSNHIKFTGALKAHSSMHLNPFVGGIGVGKCF